MRHHIPITTINEALRARQEAIRARRWKTAILVLVGVGIAFLILALLAGCGPRDEHRDRCDAKGGIVGTQYDHNHNVKAHTCIVKGKTVDVWSLPAPTPAPNWQ